MPMRGLHDNIVSKKYKNVKKRNCFFSFYFFVNPDTTTRLPAYLFATVKLATLI